MKKVLIMQCTGDKAWYKDKVGEEIEITHETVRDYCIGSWMILKIDAIELPEEITNR